MREAYSIRALVRLRPLLEDFADVVLGSILFAFGLVTLGLGVARARGASRPLIWLGVANLLYGLRLVLDTELLGSWRAVAYLVVFLTYVMPLPAILFTEQTLGRGWRSTVRVALWVQTVYAAAAVLIDSVRGPGTAMELNNPVVLLVLGILILNGVLYLRQNPETLRAAVRSPDGRTVIAGAN